MEQNRLELSPRRSVRVSFSRHQSKGDSRQPCFAGKGIADKDRNILSNQLMILGFLRSASGFLVKGPQTLGGQKEQARGCEDNTDAGSEEEGELNSQADSPGGTVIITLRNVPPYTECKVCPSHGRLR